MMDRRRSKGEVIVRADSETSTLKAQAPIYSEFRVGIKEPLAFKEIRKSHDIYSLAPNPYRKYMNKCKSTLAVQSQSYENVMERLRNSAANSPITSTIDVPSRLAEMRKSNESGSSSRNAYI